MIRWRRLVGSRPIIARLVLAVAGAMTLVLVVGSAFVYWRVSNALTQQLTSDLMAYRLLTENSLEKGLSLVDDTPGLTYQLYDRTGTILAGNSKTRLLPRAVVRRVWAKGALHGQLGKIWQLDTPGYRYTAKRLHTPTREVVAAYAISRHEQDEALRELAVQLALADLATLIAASFVGYRTLRAALDPVERYRRAAREAGEDVRLPVSDRDDELSRLGHTFNDLLDRIEASGTRERQFIADASHELRSPLTLMRTEVEWALMARDGLQDPTATLRALDSQIERMVQLCNALLDLEELRADPHVSYDAVPLHELAMQVAQRWRPVLEEQGRELRVLVPVLTVRASEHWLDLALDNLVSNAVRYGEGAVRIGATEVLGRPLSGQGPTVELWVEDDGPGIPEDFAPRAFDRFSQADSSRSGPGSGLGLAIVAAVAHAHHGTTRVEGPRVIVRLPALA